MVGVEKHGIVATSEQAVTEARDLLKRSPYGNGDAAKEIVDILMKEVGD